MCGMVCFFCPQVLFDFKRMSIIFHLTFRISNSVFFSRLPDCHITIVSDMFDIKLLFTHLIYHRYFALKFNERRYGKEIKYYSF